MAEQLETITIGEGIDNRLEYIKLPNGITYVVGLSLAEAQEMYDTLDANINAVNDDVEDLKLSEKTVAMALNNLNSRVVALTEENAQLRSEIDALTEEIALIKRDYMAYYDVDASAGIGEGNTYE